ncbi:MAG: hypothetical protein ACI4OT_05760 [Bacilli bacterium]
MKKFIFLIFLILLCSGCYYTELNDLSIIDSIGIEKVDEDMKIVMSIVNTIDYKSEDNIETTIYESTGQSIEEAFNNFYLEINKTIYLDSLNNLLISDTLNNEDISNIVNFFIKNKESRNTFNILYVKESSIKDILNSNLNLKSMLMTNNKEFGNTCLYSLEEFFSDNYNYSFVPTLYFKDKVIIDNYSVFHKYKYIGALNKDESIVYNIINNKIDKLNLNIEDKYFKILNIKTTRNNKKEINISSSIDKKESKIYNTYLRKNINKLLKKYKIYDNYNIKINTKYIKE